jgi:hypothetical protein
MGARSWRRDWTTYRRVGTGASTDTQDKVSVVARFARGPVAACPQRRRAEACGAGPGASPMAAHSLASPLLADQLATRPDPAMVARVVSVGGLLGLQAPTVVRVLVRAVV